MNDTDIAATLKRYKEEIDFSTEKLKSVAADMGLFYDRLCDIAKQYKKKSAVKDENFEEEFRAMVTSLRVLTDKSLQFWQDARGYIRSADRKELMSGNRILIKQMNIAARNFSRVTDEFETLLKTFQALSGDITLRLNWWMLESCLKDLQNISGRILFLVRDLEKNYDK